MTWLEAVLEVSVVVAVAGVLVTSVATVVGQVAKVVVGDAGSGGRAVEGVGGAGGLRVPNCTRDKLYIVDRKTGFVSLCSLSYKLNLQRKLMKARKQIF